MVIRDHSLVCKQNFPEKKHFLPPDTHNRGLKMLVFRKKMFTYYMDDPLPY